MSKDNFEVNLPPQVTEQDNVVIVTSVDSEKDAIKSVKKTLETSALDFEQKRHTYSRYLGGEESTTTDTLSLSDINDYAENPQNSLDDIKKINAIVKEYVNKDDIIGKVYESVQIYTNTQHSLKYPNNLEENGKKNVEDEIKPLVENFNKKIDIKNFISTGVGTAFLEGNFISYLRINAKKNQAVIDFYPVSMVEVTEYSIDGEPAILFNVRNLKSRLRINSRKKKNGKDIFFDQMEKMIKNNYPPEVYKAYKNNENYALLDPKRVGLVRVNNLGGLYGVTPIFKALKPALMLESIENADETIVKVRSKKIVHQKLRKEIAGTDYAKQALDEMSYAHNNLISAWKNKTVLVTTPWWVEDIKFISDDTPLTDTDTLKTYRSRVFNALGINFMDTEASLNLSNVSIADLMKTIDKIAENLAKVINKYYKVLLEENNKDIALAPEISIMTSELLSMEMRKSLAEFMFTKLGASYETSYEILGVSSAETESTKRQAEKEKKYDEVFVPHANYFNQTGESPTDTNNNGRPRGEVNAKQQYDDTRKKAKGK